MRHLTVLIVDDNPVDRECYKRFLARDPEARYTVIEAGLGEEGLELARARPPDCILLDYSLPDCDGLEFLSELFCEGRTPTCAVVMLTGKQDEALFAEATRRGARSYALKGEVGSAALVRIVAESIEGLARETHEAGPPVR